ncbi:MAG: translation initiation factor IF-2, partial [Brevinematales bacterium]
FIDNILLGMHKDEIIQKTIGTADIKEIYKIKDVGKIAGAIVKEGFIRKSEKVRLFRDGTQFWEGKLKDLKRFKDDVSEVQEGFEFGVSFVNYENFKKGDVIECYTEEIKDK